VAPPGTPEALADSINRDVAEVFRRPEVRHRLDEMKMDAVGSTRPERRASLRGGRALGAR